MELTFVPFTADDIEIMLPYYELRTNMTCDSVFLDGFLWKDFYQVRYAVHEGMALYWLMRVDGEEYAAMPMCREEDLGAAFDELRAYFNQVLGKKLRIYLADEAALFALKLDPAEYEVTEIEDARDYLYSAQALRTLSGKKLRKKKNHINAFLKEYEGRYEYRTICCSDGNEVWEFLMKWRDKKNSEAEEHLDGEVAGIQDILRNCSALGVQMGGIYIDGRLEAFTIGSYNSRMKMAIIHIEKANPDIRGLYPLINQQFLLHEFLEAEVVNREDDMGLEGLRKAKLSYEPIGFANKYRVEQR